MKSKRLPALKKEGIMPVSKDPIKRAAWLKIKREKAIEKHGAYHANLVENTKRCKQCEKTKTITDFSKQSKSFDGLDYICKTCHAENARKRRIPVPRKKKERIVPSGKLCKACHKFKPIDDFPAHRRNLDGHSGTCEECEVAKRRAKAKKTTPQENFTRLLKYNYRLTEEEYKQKLAAQNGVCAICGKPETVLFDKRAGKIRRLAIDHNHETGQIRDLLCIRCNQSFGNMHEDPELIKALLAYAEKWKS